MNGRKWVVFWVFLICLGLLHSLMACSETSDYQLPVSYDLRNVEGKSYLTPLKSQAVEGEWWNNVGLCWAFSSVSSFESSLLKKGIVKDFSSEEVNLSPWHLGCYIGYNHPNWEFNETCLGEPPKPVSYSLDSTLQHGWAGSPLFTVNWLSSGKGFVKEKDAPLPLDVMKKHGVLHPPDKALTQHYILRDAYLFQRLDYETDAEFERVIKKAIMDYGAVATATYLGIADLPGMKGKTYWRDESLTCYYCDAEEYKNQFTHMVAIVGWDDEKCIPQAPADGAWLIRDSMGLNAHDHGYYWISYYDAVFLKDYAYGVVFSGDRNTGYSSCRLQTHDGALSSPVTSSSFYESDGCNEENMDSYMCARFTSDRNGFLRALGLITMNRNENITVEVYADWDKEANQPIHLLFADTLLIPEKGYHLIELSSSLEMIEGMPFVIVLGFAAKPDGFPPLVYVTDPEIPLHAESTYIASGKGGEGNTLSPWVDYSTVRDHSALYLQAVFEE